MFKPCPPEIHELSSRETNVRFLTKLKKPVFTKKPFNPEIHLSTSQSDNHYNMQASTSPGSRFFGSPATPHALSPAQTPITYGDRRAFSAPTSASTLLALQSASSPLHASQNRGICQLDHSAIENGQTGQPYASYHTESKGYPDLRNYGRTSPFNTEVRSPSAMYDNDDILSSYADDTNGVTENPSSATDAQLHSVSVRG